MGQLITEHHHDVFLRFVVSGHSNHPFFVGYRKAYQTDDLDDAIDFCKSVLANGEMTDLSIYDRQEGRCVA